MNEYIKIDDLHVHFAERSGILRPAKPPIKAVNGVSFAIQRGTTFGLVGESGSGKSTIARAILGLVDANQGHILVGPHDVTSLTRQELKKYRKQIQVVFQDPYSSLNPSHTVSHIVGELVSLHRGIGAGPSREDIVGDLLEQVGLGRHIMNRYPFELSGGQRQRVAIARALSVEPEMIICDESTSALDVSIQSQVINLLEDIQERTGISYLFITHDLAVVRHISHEIGVMYLGYLVETGPSERIYNEAAHPYTTMLLAAEPVPNPEQQKRRAELRRMYHTDVEPPSPANLPKGCPFANRCALVMDICEEEMPEATPVEGGGTVRCHLHTSGPQLDGGSVLSLLLDRRTEKG